MIGLDWLIQVFRIAQLVQPLSKAGVLGREVRPFQKRLHFSLHITVLFCFEHKTTTDLDFSPCVGAWRFSVVKIKAKQSEVGHNGGWWMLYLHPAEEHRSLAQMWFSEGCVSQDKKVTGLTDFIKSALTFQSNCKSQLVLFWTKLMAQMFFFPLLQSVMKLSWKLVSRSTLYVMYLRLFAFYIFMCRRRSSRGRSSSR